MAIQCMVCNKKYNPQDKREKKLYSFHTLPNKGSVRAKWLDFIYKHKSADWTIKIKRVIVCYLHFRLEDYLSLNFRHVTLKPLAYPTIFDNDSDEKSCVPMAAKRSYSQSTPEELLELGQLSSSEKLDSPPEKKTKVLPSETPSCTSTDATENATSSALQSTENPQVAQIEHPKMMQKLRNLYQLQQQQVLDLENCQPLNETDLKKYRFMKNHVSLLQESIFNWALSAIQEAFEISAEQEAQVSKFTQSNYILLNADNKLLRSAVASRDIRLTLIKKTQQCQLENFESERDKLKIRVKDLEEQNKELKKNNKELKAQNASLDKEKIKFENSFINLQAANINQVEKSTEKNQILQVQLSQSLKSQADLEERLSNDHKKLMKSGQELIEARRLGNSMVRQLHRKDVKFKSLLELEKGYKLMMNRIKSCKNNTFTEQASEIDNSLANAEVMSSQSDILPTTCSAASYDPQQDPDGEYSALQEAQIMIVVESDDEQLEIEASEEEYQVASGYQASVYS